MSQLSGNSGAVSGVESEGVDQGSPVVLNITGAGVNTSTVNGVTTIDIPGGGSGIATQEEGVPVGAAQTTLNLVGAGVTAASVGNTTTITIPGGGGGGSGAAGPPGLNGLDGDEGQMGVQGATGSTGSTGASGAPGPAIFMLGDDSAEDGSPGPPGPQGATGATGPAGGGGSSDAMQFSFVDDFMSASNVFNQNWFVSVSTDTITSNSSTGMTAGHPGIAIFNGSTTSGRSSLSNAIGGVIIGATTSGLVMEAIFYVDALDSGTNNYTLIIGLGDAFTSATQTNGVYFRYNGSTNSGQLEGIVMAASTPQTVSGGVGAALTAGAWWKVRFTVNAAGTSIQFDYSIAGAAYVSLGTAVTTGFPTGQIGPIIGKFNSGAGAGSRILRVDYYGLTATLIR